MDNDGALLEVLRNTYKGLRFRWKYRGLIILPAEQGNAAAADAIRAGQPFLFGRCGATEMPTVAEPSCGFACGFLKYKRSPYYKASRRQFLWQSKF